MKAAALWLVVVVLIAALSGCKYDEVQTFGRVFNAGMSAYSPQPAPQPVYYP